MRVIIIGGFLGSGKTTTMLKLAKHIASEGLKTAIIVNEIGEIGIDGEVLKTSGIETTQLTEGCICCTLKYTMEETILEINEFFKPDVLLIEPTGVAIPEQIREELGTINIPIVFSPILTIVDAYRLRAGVKQVSEFFATQLRGADIIAINKIDLVNEEEIGNVEKFLDNVNKTAERIKISANKEKDIGFLYNMLVLTENLNNFETEEIIDEKGERSNLTVIENSAEFSNVSTASGIYEFVGNVPISKANRLLKSIMKSTKKSLKNLNDSFVGHIKISIPFYEKETLLKISLTGADEKPVVENLIIEKPSINENEIIAGTQRLYYMAAVTNVSRSKLENILKNAIELYLESYTKSFKKLDINKKSEPEIFELV